MEIRRQLRHVLRDLGYLEAYMAEGYALPGRDIGMYLTIRKLYEQQRYRYDNKTHQVSDRIVNLSSPISAPSCGAKRSHP